MKEQRKLPDTVSPYTHEHTEAGTAFRRPVQGQPVNFPPYIGEGFMRFLFLDGSRWLLEEAKSAYFSAVALLSRILIMVQLMVLHP